MGQEIPKEKWRQNEGEIGKREDWRGEEKRGIWEKGRWGEEGGSE